jgi:methylated-DNA-protein-cysteine methyltransferase-like protein
MQAQEADINSRIWQVVTLIPAGKVATYGDVAKHAGLPGAARRVGNALRGLPYDTRIPWHRVINARGRISLPEDTASYYRQRERLESEGVAFGINAAVDMKRFRWQPAGAP